MASAEAKTLILFGVADFTGASKMGYYFALAFQRAGLPVVAACPPRLPADFGGSKDFPSINDMLARHAIVTHVIEGMERLASGRAVRQLATVLRRERITHVVDMHQNTMKYAAAATRLTGVRHVSSRQGPVIMYGGRATQAMKHLIFKWCARSGTDLSVCLNEPDRRQMLDQYGCRPDRVVLLENGIDLEPFADFTAADRAATRAEFGVAADELLLINVGRLDPQKDQLTLLRAFHLAKPFPQRVKLMLVGNVTAVSTDLAESHADRLTRFVREQGLEHEVIFTGWRNDIPALLQSADVYVHAALWEGFPLVMCEAMAARLPFIGTDCFGTPAGFVQGETGFLVPKANPEALARAIRTVVAMTPDERARLGAAGRRLLEERYDIRQIGARFVDLVTSVVG